MLLHLEFSNPLDGKKAHDHSSGILIRHSLTSASFADHVLEKELAVA